MIAAIVSILDCFPGLRRVLCGMSNSFSLRAGVPFNYLNLQGGEADAERQCRRNSWQGHALPKRLRELVNHQLPKCRTSTRFDVVVMLMKSMRALLDLVPGASMLEVGCSSRFYSELMAIVRLPIKYFDVFVRLAKEKHPSIDFVLEDAATSSYAGYSFEVVVSGCCLLHIPKYEKGVVETAYVATPFSIARPSRGAGPSGGSANRLMV